MSEYTNIPIPDSVSNHIPIPGVDRNSRQNIAIPVPNMDATIEQSKTTSTFDKPNEKIDRPTKTETVVKKESKFVPVDKKASTKKSMGVTVKKTNVTTDDMRRTVIKGVPRRMIQEMRTEFPQAENQTDLLVAWIASHADGSWHGWMHECLTEKQESLLTNQDLLPFATMEKQLSVLAKKNDALRHQLDQVILLCSYLVYDRLGYREELIPPTPDQIHFDEYGLLSLIEHSELSSKAIFHEKRISDGRAIK